MTSSQVRRAKTSPLDPPHEVLFDHADALFHAEFTDQVASAPGFGQDPADGIGLLENSLHWRRSFPPGRRHASCPRAGYRGAGRLGTSLEHLSRLAGFDWRTNIALVGGFAAKEVILSTLGTAHSLGEVNPAESDSLSEKLASSSEWRPVSAIALILFIMFYAPCFVSVVCIAREAGSWKWGLFSIVFKTMLDFMLAAVVYQVGTLIGF